MNKLMLICIIIFPAFALNETPQQYFPPSQVFHRDTSIYLGIKYESAVTEADISSAPQWPETDEYPPLSPRSAIRAAEKFITNTFPAFNPWFDHVSLRPVGHDDYWVYLVEFRPVPEGGLDGYSRPFNVIVLMNGNVIQPKDIGPFGPLTKKDNQGEQPLSPR